MVFDSIGTALPHVAGGLVRAIAVTSPKRSQLPPDIPTIQESGYPGFDVTVHYGLFAPAGTPQPIIDRLNKAVNDYLMTPEVIERFKVLGMESNVGPPKLLGDAMKSEHERWKKIIADANIRIE